jgi:hypothetical protein
MATDCRTIGQPHLPGVSVEAIARALSQVMPRPLMFALSTTTGHGLGPWLEWLVARHTSDAAVQTLLDRSNR